MLVSPSGPTRAERVARGVDLLTGWGLRVATAPERVPALRLPRRHRRRSAWPTSTWPCATPRCGACCAPAAGTACSASSTASTWTRCGPTRRSWSASPTSPPCSSRCGAARGWPRSTGRARPGWTSGPARRRPSRCAGASWSTSRWCSRPATTRRPRRYALDARPGRSAAPLLGGNLSLLCASVGTRDMPDLRGADPAPGGRGRASVQGGPDAAAPAPGRLPRRPGRRGRSASSPTAPTAGPPRSTRC